MVTREQIHELNSRRPFQPFRITLLTGETLDVTRTAQAVAMRDRVVVGTPDDRWRWIGFDRIDRVESLGADCHGHAAPAARSSIRALGITGVSQPADRPHGTMVNMVTEEQVREHNGRRPFQPFRIRLTSGEAIDITRRNQAITLRRRVGVVMPDDSFRWIWFEHTDQIEPLAPVSG